MIWSAEIEIADGAIVENWHHGSISNIIEVGG